MERQVLNLEEMGRGTTGSVNGTSGRSKGTSFRSGGLRSTHLISEPDGYSPGVTRLPPKLAVVPDMHTHCSSSPILSYCFINTRAQDVPHRALGTQGGSERMSWTRLWRSMKDLEATWPSSPLPAAPSPGDELEPHLRWWVGEKQKQPLSISLSLSLYLSRA